MKTKFSRNGSPAVGARDGDVGENKGQAALHYSEGQKHPPSRKLRRKQSDNQSTAPPVPPEPERSSTDIEGKEATRIRVLSIFGRGKK
jgi:hypothetical protein